MKIILLAYIIKKVFIVKQEKERREEEIGDKKMAQTMNSELYFKREQIKSIVHMVLTFQNQTVRKVSLELYFLEKQRLLHEIGSFDFRNVRGLDMNTIVAIHNAEITVLNKYKLSYV